MGWGRISAVPAMIPPITVPNFSFTPPPAPIISKMASLGVLHHIYLAMDAGFDVTGK